MFGKFRKFFSEVIVELKKASWTSRQELVDTTWIVVISSLVLGVYIGGTDFVLSKILGIIVK